MMASDVLPSTGNLGDRQAVVNFNEDQISRNTGLENLCVPTAISVKEPSDQPDFKSNVPRRTRKDRRAANV